MHHIPAGPATAAEAAGRSPRGVLAPAREHPVATDRVLTAVLVAVSLAGLWLVSWSKTAQYYRAPDAGGVLLTLAIVVPLLWRRQRPDLVLVISGTALLGYDAAGYRSGLAWLACYWAVYSYAVHRRRRDAYWPLAVWIAAVVAHLALPARGSNTAQTALIFLGVTAFVWLCGDAVRSGLVGAELSAYRIVQEALTNTLKHSGAGHATVRLSWSQDHLDVQVSDDGPVAGAAVPPPVRADSGGKGLVGMRGRVLLFGGELEAGPSPHGGYRVAARLPLKGMA